MRKDMDFYLSGELCREAGEENILECEHRRGGIHDDDYESINIYRKTRGKRIWWVVGEGGRASEWCVDGAMALVDKAMGVTVFVSAKAFPDGEAVLDFMRRRGMKDEIFRLQEYLECYDITKKPR